MQETTPLYSSAASDVYKRQEKAEAAAMEPKVVIKATKTTKVMEIMRTG